MECQPRVLNAAQLKKPDGLNNTACHRYIGQIGVGPGPQRYRGGRSQGWNAKVNE